MARRRSGSFWIRRGPDPQPELAPGADEEPSDEPGRPARSEHRARMVDLKELALRLAKLPPGIRRTLPLDDETLHELEVLAASPATPGRRRQVMRVKALLDGADLDRLHAALEGGGDRAEREREAVRWRGLIIEGDDATIQTFLEAFPGADRQSLRAAAREARGQGPAAARAQGRLLQLLREATLAPPDDGEE